MKLRLFVWRVGLRNVNVVEAVCLASRTKECKCS